MLLKIVNEFIASNSSYVTYTDLFQLLLVLLAEADLLTRRMKPK